MIARRLAPGLLLAALLGSGCGIGAPRLARFTDVRYPYAGEHAVSSRRARAEVWVARAGPAPEAGGRTPLVLLHPWGTNMKIWRPVVPALAADRPVLLVDLPGHGKSSKTPGRYPPERLALAVLDAMRAEGFGRAIVMGNSLGGGTALQVALQEPGRVAGLVLVGAPGGAAIPEPIRRMVRSVMSPTTVRTVSDELVGFAWLLVGRTGDPVAREMFHEWVGLRGSKEWPDFARATSSSIVEVLDWRPRVERIRSPALVVQGALDIIVWPWNGEALAERLPAGRLEMIAGCGHVPELECPEALLDRVRPFLEAVDAGRALPAPAR